MALWEGVHYFHRFIRVTFYQPETCCQEGYYLHVLAVTGSVGCLMENNTNNTVLFIITYYTESKLPREMMSGLLSEDIFFIFYYMLLG